MSNFSGIKPRRSFFNNLEAAKNTVKYGQEINPTPIKNEINTSKLLNGNGEPNNQFGGNGDLYINLNNFSLFIKKNDGWILIGNFDSEIGGQILSGVGFPTHTHGTNGDFYINLENNIPLIKNNNQWENINLVSSNSVHIDNKKPDNSIGNTNDIFINVSTSDFYLKINSKWILIGNINKTPETGKTNIKQNDLTVIKNDLLLVKNDVQTLSKNELGGIKNDLQALKREILNSKFITGFGVPKSSIGQNNALFLDISTMDIYIKLNNVWNLVGNISSANKILEKSIEKENLLQSSKTSSVADKSSQIKETGTDMIAYQSVANGLSQSKETGTDQTTLRSVANGSLQSNDTGTDLIASQSVANGSLQSKEAGTILPYMSGFPIVLSEKIAAVIGFGTAISGVCVVNNLIDQTNVDGLPIYYAFPFARNGIITSISSFFSITADVSITNPGTSIVAQVYVFNLQKNIFEPVPEANVVHELGVGPITKGTALNGMTSGLKINIPAQSRLLLAYVISTPVTDTEFRVMGHASASINIV